MKDGELPDRSGFLSRRCPKWPAALDRSKFEAIARTPGSVAQVNIRGDRCYAAANCSTEGAQCPSPPFLEKVPQLPFRKSRSHRRAKRQNLII
jgi:hypothetical protein